MSYDVLIKNVTGFVVCAINTKCAGFGMGFFISILLDVFRSFFLNWFWVLTESCGPDPELCLFVDEFRRIRMLGRLFV